MVICSWRPLCDSKDEHKLPFENSTNVGSFCYAIGVVDIDCLLCITPFTVLTFFEDLDELGTQLPISYLLDHDFHWPVFLHVLVVFYVVKARLLVLWILQQLDFFFFHFILDVFEKGFFFLVD